MNQKIIKILFHNLFANLFLPVFLIIFILLLMITCYIYIQQSYHYILNIIFNILPIFIIIYKIYGLVRIILLIEQKIKEKDSVIEYFTKKKWRDNESKTL